MATKRAVGGYAFRAELTRGKQATLVVRVSLRRVVEEQPGPQTQAMLLARAALALGEIQAALDAIDEIAKAARRAN
jgi:hypothetical protein